MQALTVRSFWRYLWAGPASLVGLLLALPMLCRGAAFNRVDGVLEIAPRQPKTAHREGPRFIAITFGHVILGESAEILARWRQHEFEHVRQYELWGVLFFVAYPLASLWAWLHGGRPYWDNAFEIAARRAEPD